MREQLAEQKSCGPQLFPSDQPSHAWGLEKLGRYAQRQNEAIIAGEKQITPAYWRLGQALQIARKQFGRSQWGRYLAELGIEKTRASKARAIFATFSTEQEVTDLTVDEAYGRRIRRQTQRSRKKVRNGGKPASLQNFLDHVPANANQLMQEIGKVEPGQAHRLLGQVERAIEQLGHLRAYLQQQVDFAAGNEPTSGSRSRATNRPAREVDANDRAREDSFVRRRRRGAQRWPRASGKTENHR